MYSSSELIVRSCGYRTPFAALTVTRGPDRAGTCQKPAMAAGNCTEVRAKLARIGSARRSCKKFCVLSRISSSKPSAQFGGQTGWRTAPWQHATALGAFFHFAVMLLSAR